VQGFPQRKSMAYPLSNDCAEKQETSLYYNWLLEKLADLQEQDQKAILICQQAETVIELEKDLRKKKGIAVAVFHERMSIVERDRAAAYFSDEESTVQLLICSEIGSEGRNFQFVHHLILFELPENPDLLQQRIGRLDRIGQKNDIQIHIPYILGSAQHFLFRWYEEGFNAFQVNSSAASQVGVELKSRFDQLLNSQSSSLINQFMIDTQQLHKKIKNEMQKGRDHLLELSSCRNAPAEELIRQIKNIDSNNLLWNYMEAIFDCYGVEVERHSRDCYILRPSEQLRIDSFPLLAEEGVTVTTNRAIALEREEFQFLTQEHPMVLAVMELVQSTEVGNAALSVIRHPQLSAGQFLLELIFVVECSAPSKLRVNKYLPHVPIRILMDQNIKDVSAQISHQDMVETGDRVEKEKIKSFISSQKDHITKMIKQAEKVANQQMQQIIDKSNEAMLYDLSAEIKRMEQLKKINPSIKKEEIEWLKDRVVVSTEKIKKAQLKFDAVRFVITS
jgi:ATP-dependent helicase HepA